MISIISHRVNGIICLGSECRSNNFNNHGYIGSPFSLLAVLY